MRLSSASPHRCLTSTKPSFANSARYLVSTQAGLWADLECMLIYHKGSYNTRISAHFEALHSSFPRDTNPNSQGSDKFDGNISAPGVEAMRYISFYRVATFVLLMFCTGHTIGGMLQQKSMGSEADAVFESMKAVEFNFKGATCTWYGFWFGSGLTASIFLLLSAIIAWQLDNVPPEQWHLTSVIAWGLVAAHLANTILAWAYFFAGAGVLSTGITMLLAAGAWRKQSQRALAHSQKKL
jgi:hypothetical protein